MFLSASQIIPTVRIEPVLQKVNVFDKTEFRCITTGHPTPKVDWSRKNDQINSDADISGGFLRILNTTHADEDDYYCTATNYAGFTKVKATLQVTLGKVKHSQN